MTEAAKKSLIRIITAIEGTEIELNAEMIKVAIDRELDNPFNPIQLSEEEVKYVFEEMTAYAKREKSEISEIFDKSHTFWWKMVKQKRLNALNNKVNGSGKGYWNRYLWKLKDDKFPYDELDTFTDRIFDFCEDPQKKGKWDRRGLVVGHVQSGKTANFIGLCNKAIDAGYKLVIVIAGIHNNLRNQTQERIEKDLIGRSTRKDFPFVGVSKYRDRPDVDNSIPVPTTLTNFEEDFDTRQITKNLTDLRNSKAPTILVVKKNVKVLRSLISWLSIQANREVEGVLKIGSLPMLVIDDEADNASLNTNKDDRDPTTINRLIRILLNLFEQKSFIGYTATPYANIFVSEDNNHEKEFEIDNRKYELGEGLFPKDFIVNIKPGSNYFGASRIFGSADLDRDIEELNLLRVIDDQTETSEFPIKISKENKYNLPEVLPNSLKTALKSHFIAASIKLLRGDEQKHCSMMVHVSHLVLWMDKIAVLTKNEVEYYKSLILNDDNDFYNELEELFNADFVTTTKQAMEVFAKGEEPRIKPSFWEELKPHLKSAANRFVVFSVHGTVNGRKKVYSEDGKLTEPKSGKKYDYHLLEHTNESPFDYNDPRYKNGLFAIAIGGNRMSRGLTVEGLTTTYYLRVSKLYDTLMQMGRWFGYRPGYVDLCRIYTTQELINYYRHIVHATDKMRIDFDDMAAAGKTPSEYQLKVMTHPSFLSITSAGKMRDQKKMKVKFSGDQKTTFQISKQPEKIKSNFEGLKEFISSLEVAKFSDDFTGLKYTTGDYGEKVADFIDRYFTNQLSMRTDVLSSYIRNITESNTIKKWTIAIADNTNKRVKIKIDGEEDRDSDVLPIELNAGSLSSVNAVVRNEPITNSNTDVKSDYLIRKQQIISPNHAYFDLGITKEEFSQNKGKSKRSLVKKKRKEINKALLIVYLLDPRAVKHVDDDIPLVGFYLDFPEIDHETGVEYSVNSRGINDENYYDDDDDDDE
jgi:hypothetical protein